jgi:uncharacterized membrane protein YGL010W
MDSAMQATTTPLLKVLAQYAQYHRSKRNVWTHFIGVPLIVFAVMVLLARANILLGSYHISAMWILLALSCLYYLKLELAIGALMTVIFVIMGYFAQQLAFLPFVQWLALGIGMFAVGWIFQFIGHHIERKKPAFVDDLIGLMIGPLFVTVELLFLLGLRKPLEAQIAAFAGPMRE